MQNTKKGFTLIELLIVIGILAILVAAVVVVLNPAQLLAQARDGQRMSDMDSIRSAINLDLATVSGATLTATTTVTASTTGALQPSGWTAVINASTAVNGTGWVNVDLTQISGGSPLSRLPIDPTNSGAYYYGFKTNSATSTYKIIARLESTKYQTKMTSDGGTLNTCSNYTEATCFYEIGSDVTGI